MVKVQRLIKPNRKSGYELAPGATTIVRGLTIVNGNEFPVFVDKFSKKKKAKKLKKAKK